MGTYVYVYMYICIYVYYTHTHIEIYPCMCIFDQRPILPYLNVISEKRLAVTFHSRHRQRVGPILALLKVGPRGEQVPCQAEAATPRVEAKWKTHER